MTWEKGESGCPDRKWKKGQSGNPKGPDKWDRPIREALLEHAPQAVARLVELMRSDDQQIALAAVREILNRVYGKAPVAVGVDIDRTEIIYQVIAPKEAGSFDEWLESVNQIGS
jgi:flagellar biosynthesis/type III secretory pathway protein FliH